MPPLLRRGRFLVFAHAVLVHADPYGVLTPRPGLDRPWGTSVQPLAVRSILES
jgi:hypothetical protein